MNCSSSGSENLTSSILTSLVTDSFLEIENELKARKKNKRKNKKKNGEIRRSKSNANLKHKGLPESLPKSAGSPNRR